MSQIHPELKYKIKERSLSYLSSTGLDIEIGIKQYLTNLLNLCNTYNEIIEAVPNELKKILNIHAVTPITSEEFKIKLNTFLEKNKQWETLLIELLVAVKLTK